jgi:hypothetical protein
MQTPPHTVPRSLTPELRTFCQSISSSEPVFINSIPVQGSLAGFCFDNVERKVRRSGGPIEYGWAIWNFPALYFEAEHHAVWRNKKGTLIDVSPQMAGRRRMLFLPDETAVHDPMRPRQSILAPDGITTEATEMTSLGNQRHSLLMRCRVPGTPEIRLFEADQIELAEINSRIQALIVR